MRRPTGRAARVLVYVLVVLLSISVFQMAPFTRAQAAGRIVMTSWGGDWEKFLREDILPDFQKQTNTTVELAIGLSKDWVANMLSAGVDKARYDIVVTDELWASALRRRGVFAGLRQEKCPERTD